MKRLLATVVLLLLLLPGRWSRAEECGELIIAAVEFAGCGSSRCSSPKKQARYVDATQLLGRKGTGPAIEQARKRLLETGVFLEVSAHCQRVTALDAKVTFEVVPNRFVRKVKVSGTKILFASDLEKRVFINPGAIFNPDLKESRERLERQQANLASYMRQEGLDTATVEVEVKLVEPDMVDIFFHVDEGKVSRVDKVVVEL